MAFDTYHQPAPAAIGTLVVTLKTRPAIGSDAAIQSAHYQVEVLDADGRRINQLSGNLVPHLTQAQITALLGFMADLRVQAEEQILP